MQPAVTQGLARLEQQFGPSVLDRLHAGMRMSAGGAILHARVRLFFPYHQAAGHVCYMPDAPGFGRSERPVLMEEPASLRPAYATRRRENNRSL